MPVSSHLLPQLVSTYIDSYPKEAASSLESLSEKEMNDFLGSLSHQRVAHVLPYMDFQRTGSFMSSLEDAPFSEVMLNLNSSLGAALLSHQDQDKLQARLERLPKEIGKELKELASFPEDSAGRMMDRRFLSFSKNASVGQVLNAIRKHPHKKIYDVVVLDDEKKFLAMLSLQMLATSQLKEILAELPKNRKEYVSEFAPQEEVVEVFEKSKVTTLPVVNVEGYVIGVIRHDELVTAIQEDAAANLLTMVGASPEERALSAPFFAVKKRLPWLSINLLTAFLASAVVGIFEGTIAKITALAVLLPVVAGQSGNTGAQAMAVTMRGLSLREVRVRHWPRLVWKECRAGFVNGSAVAVMTSIGVFIWSRNIALCLVIGTAMVMSMVIASISGAAVPVLLTAVGKDPAQSSSIILTTVTDIMGFLSFLGLATLFSNWLA